MSVQFEDKISHGSSHFSTIRDSFYLLSVMNQYTMRTSVRRKKEAEGLLRIVLFSKDLRLLRRKPDPNQPGSKDVPESEDREVDENSRGGSLRSGTQFESPASLNNERQRLAKELRAWRRRAVVPVYISTAWFLFSLAISIQSAFGLAGQNPQAHDLALGLSLSWLPVMILSSIVDGNPIAANEIRDKLNDLVDHVRRSLMNDTIKRMYLNTISQHPEEQSMRARVEEISTASPSLERFFGTFAGQGRIRWHYGQSCEMQNHILKLGNGARLDIDRPT